MSADIPGVGERDDAFPFSHWRGDEFHSGGSPDARGLPPKGLRTRGIYIPDLHIDSTKVRPGIFNRHSDDCADRRVALLLSALPHHAAAGMAETLNYLRLGSIDENTPCGGYPRCYEDRKWGKPIC